MTDLETEIDTLRELNTSRIESGELRDEGIKILTALLKQGKIQDSEPLQLSYISMVLWELLSCPSDPLENLKELMRRFDDLKLETIIESPAPLLLAAGVVQALTATPSFTFTKSLLCCYYLIIRELYTVDTPDWGFGGARVDPESGMASAQVTGECVRALLELARILENTSDFIAKVGEIHKRVDQLGRMQTSFPELQEFGCSSANTLI